MGRRPGRLGREAPRLIIKHSNIDTLPSGGRQAAETDECRYLDPRWLLAIAAGLTAGAQKYGPDNWRRIPAHEHAWRAVRHLLLWLAGDQADEHIINASMRCMMAHVTCNSRGDGNV